MASSKARSEISVIRLPPHISRGRLASKHGIRTLSTRQTRLYPTWSTVWIGSPQARFRAPRGLPIESAVPHGRNILHLHGLFNSAPQAPVTCVTLHAIHSAAFPAGQRMISASVGYSPTGEAAEGPRARLYTSAATCNSPNQQLTTSAASCHDTPMESAGSQWRIEAGLCGRQQSGYCYSGFQSIHRNLGSGTPCCRP